MLLSEFDRFMLTLSVLLFPNGLCVIAKSLSKSVFLILEFFDFQKLKQYSSTSFQSHNFEKVRNNSRSCFANLIHFMFLSFVDLELIQNRMLDVSSSFVRIICRSLLLHLTQ